AAVEATGAGLTPWGAIALEAMRGREQDAAAILEDASADATARGEGIGLTVIAWARALLYNGLARYDDALAAAPEAGGCPPHSAAAAWGMVELIEAATRSGQSEAAREIASRFTRIATAVETDWALGVDARCRALLSDGTAADELYREAIGRLSSTRLR